MRVGQAMGWIGTYVSVLLGALAVWPAYVLRNLHRLLFSWTLFPLGVGLIAADQLLKYLAVVYLKDQPPVVLIPNYFDLTYVINRGAAFGLFRGQITAFIMIAIFTVVVILVYLSMVEEDEHLVSVALVMILAGAVGNLIDRATLGYVIDYIHVHYYELSWPVFNLADVIIDVGVGLIVLDVILDARRSSADEDEGEGEAAPA